MLLTARTHARNRIKTWSATGGLFAADSPASLFVWQVALSQYFLQTLIFFLPLYFVQVEGLFFDELSKIRVLDTSKAAETVELRDECKQFVDRIGQFQGTVGGLIDLVSNLAKAVEAQKLNVSLSTPRGRSSS